jgi:metal-responsive CopG/Arc/MetJ family transcriptional regulator
MKPVQILMDEPLLRRLDADEEVRRFGRSAVLRRAAADYLRRARAKRIAEAYRLGYATDSGLGEEFAGWQDEGSWPAR